MEVFEAIKTRRSIRHYKSDSVTEEQVSTILEAARWAPSWANTQCWKFIVVRDEEMKDKLIETLTPTNISRAAVKQAPVLIVVCAELGKSGFKEGVQKTEKGDWYMFDVALAAHNLSLSAHALGLGTVHIGLFDGQEAARVLNVPQGVVVVEMLPVGYPAKEAKAPPRKELTELVFHESYGQR